MIANIWQFVIALCYVNSNTVLSGLSVAREWAQYAVERKTLRVSHPQGIQRSTYFISTPLRYGLPVLLLFSLEHWIFSQATFIQRVVVIDTANISGTGELPGWTTSGYSFVPALISKHLIPSCSI